MEYDVNNFVQKAMDKIKEEYKNMKSVNIMLLGKSGVGKSTLVNSVFNEKLAETGVGRPVTQQITKYTKGGFPLAVYDTPGIEFDGENAFDSLLEGVKGEIKKGLESGDVGQAIHCIWYCVSTPSSRFEQSEIDFLRKFLDGDEKYQVPVIIVLTKSFSKSDAAALKSEIQKENLPVVNIVPVLAESYSIDDDYVAKSYGLDILVDITSNVIPDSVQKAFAAVQKVNLKLKQKKAHAVVVTSATAAAATGAVPIPFSDAAVLVPEQIAMLSEITAVFGLPVEKGLISAIVSSTIGSTLATVLGKTIVSNLLKLIPGVGSAVGGVISGATAAALTTALGEAYIMILTLVCKGEMTLEELNTAAGKEKIKKIFHDRLKLKRNDKGEALEDKIFDDKD